MRTKLIIWIAACSAISVIFFGELWARLPGWLSPDGIQRHGVYHWGVLALCVLWLFLRRKDILPKMQTGGLSVPFILGGVALLAFSVFMPRSDDSLIFLMLLGWLGIFTIIFSRAAVIPTILLVIYGFSLAFPIVALRWLGEPSAIAVADTVTPITRMIGLPVASNEQVLRFTSLNGDVISTTVTPGCAGYATIGMFLALFALMMLDVRLPLRKAWWIFLLGLAGTWLQNIVRIVVAVAASYHWGWGGLEATHYNISYVIFPLWYAIFAFVYLKQAGWRSISTENKG